MTSWYENGQKKSEENIKDGKPDGLSTFWDENGQSTARLILKNGKTVKRLWMSPSFMEKLLQNSQ